MMDKEQLIECLTNGVCKITFIKKDGEARTMRATRKVSILPEDAIPKNTIVEKENAPIRVFDIEKSAWRSFNHENLIAASYEK